jgi:RNA polymerase sigma-70 factor (ECF subfamily)
VNEPLTTIDEAQLVQRIAQRDRQAFSQLYNRYASALYGTAMQIVNDPDEASDILRAAFLQIWNQPGAYDPWLGRPFHWALTLTRNLAIDRLRSLKRRYHFLEEETGGRDRSASEWAAGPSEFIDQKKVASIRAAVQTLPLEQRQAIEMAFLGGMTHNEIAETLNQPLGIIKARIRRGMLELRDGLKDAV